MSVRRALIACLLLLGGSAASRAWALGEGEPIHHSADKTFWDRKTNRVQLNGHAVVNQPGETIQADQILLDLNDRLLDAKGNVVYIASDSVIYADEMHFHLDTRSGSIIGGRVLNTQFTLVGERINKLGDGRFQTHWGEYTTCRDCPSSWSLAAEDVDLIFGGYGFFRNMTAKIKDAPAVWLPYLIVPIKTHRQSGFLFPRFSYSGPAGFMGVLPFFWAIHRSADMTLGLGLFSARGFRGEWEGRYELSPFSRGIANFNYISDSDMSTYSGFAHRWNLNVAQNQRFKWGFTERLKLAELSDNLYPYSGAPDAPQNDPTLRSRLTLSHLSPLGAVHFNLLRQRSLLNTDPGMTAVQRQISEDPRTVQVYPRAQLMTRDWFFFGAPVAFGLGMTFDNFTRRNGDFDPFNSSTPLVFRPGVDPLRSARRFTATPNLYVTLRPFDIFTLVPSVQYRMFYYNFAPTSYELLRAYPVFKVDFFTQIERIFDRPDVPERPRLKHLLRPTLSYSLIPSAWLREDALHPFLQQIQTSQALGVSGFQFDNADIVPITSSPSNRNYVVPIGHALAYGLRTQWIFRTNPVEQEVGAYTRFLELYANHALNFLDPQSPLFTRFNAGAEFAFGALSFGATYQYTPPFPAAPFHSVTFSAAYNLESGIHQKILEYNRSFSLSFVNDGASNARSLSLGAIFSINDYIMPSASIAYDLTGFTFQSANAGIVFQSTSHCWKFKTSGSYSPATNFVGPLFELTVNLNGAGFGSLQSVAEGFVSR